MKKLFFIVVLLGLAYFSLKPLGILSYDDDFYVLDYREEITHMNNLLYVDAPCKDGLTHRVYVSLQKQGNKMNGTLYLPGDAITEDSYYSWDNNLRIEKRLKGYDSGEYRIAGPNYSFKGIVKYNGKRYYACIETLQCSEEVSPLFITIDESKGSIADMNNDPIHETECFGKAEFMNQVYPISIKGRGNSTWIGDKKPYNITFTNEDYSKKVNASMIDGIETKKWSLLADFFDKSLIRNKLGYDFACNLGIGLESKYFDIWMNGQYLGNYLITPKNDYLASDTGFILELDNFIDNEDPQFHLSANGREVESLLFTVKNDDGGYGVENIQNYIQNIFNKILDYDSEDYQKYIDMDSWAKMYLFYEIAKPYDVINGSILMHVDDINNPVLVAGPIWDMDLAYGSIDVRLNNYTGGLETGYQKAVTADYWYIDTLELKENDFCFLMELGKHRSFIEKVKEVYREYKNDIDSLVANVNEIYFQLSISGICNLNRWPESSKYYTLKTEKTISSDNLEDFTYCRTDDFYGYTWNLITFLNYRLQFIEEHIDEK